MKAYELLLDVVKMSEKSACNLRELVSRYGYPEEQDELEQIVLGSHPVDIGFPDYHRYPRKESSISLRE